MVSSLQTAVTSSSKKSSARQINQLQADGKPRKADAQPCCGRKEAHIMKWLLPLLLSTAGLVAAQDTFTVTGTPIPADLLKTNYGPMPKGVAGFDINLCNVTAAKHSITSSQIYQALMEAQPDLQPIGREIMLAAILRNQNHSLSTMLSLGLTSTTGVLSVLRAGRTAASAGALSAVALGALVGQQLLNTWSPVLTADQVEKFEAQVLEPALVMDSGSCVERTIFTTVVSSANKAARRRVASIELHVQ